MNTIRRSIRLVVPILAAAALSSCGSSTKFTDIWTAPDIEPYRAQKVLVVFLTADQSMRRIGEDEMVRQIKRAEAVPSYTFLDKDQVKDFEYAKQQTVAMGFDLAIAMRLVGVDEKQTYVSGTYMSGPYYSSYYSYWGYSRYAWPVVYEPGYIETNKYVQMETNFYDVKKDKLVWSGRSETVDPSSVSKLVEDVAFEARKVLGKQGLLPSE